MMAFTATLARPAWAGLTVYVAFLLSFAAHAAGPARTPVPPAPAPAATDPGAIAQAPANMAARPAPAIGSPTPYGPLPPPAPAFSDTIYGSRATPGPPGAPGFLHPHFPENQSHYGIWYQPRSYLASQRKPYRPRPFRPRGFGNVFYEPCRQLRMDYNREVVTDLPSQYGPSYYPHYSWPSECLFRPERHYSPPIWGEAE